MAKLTSDMKDILQKCSTSTEACCKTFYPDRFSLPFSPAHREVFKILDDDSIQLVCIAAWRGFGKSSIVQLGYPTKQILFRNSGFIMPISCTTRQAEMQAENLKRQLVTNVRLKQFGFKNLQSNVWAKDLWITNTPTDKRIGTMVMPRGVGQQVRGLLFDNERPDTVIIDDLEDSESVLSEEQRAKRLEWFYSDVLGCIDKSSKKWRIIYIGTILHEDSLLVNLLRDTHWHSLRLSLCDDEGNSAWPEQIDNAGIQELREKYKSQGLLDAFYREYRNIPMAKEGAPFKSENFRYYEPEKLKNKYIEYVVIVDPGKSVSARACDTAIVGIGIDIMENKFYVADIVCQQFHPDEMIEESFRMCTRLGAKVLGVEVTGSAEFISWPFKNEIRRQAFNVEFVELKARKGPSQYVPHGSTQHGKDARIGAGLVPLYNNGLIYHNQNHRMTQVLETQLITYPRGRKKDIIDALSYIVELMSIGDRFFAATKFTLQEDAGRAGHLNEEYEAKMLADLIKSDEKEPAGWRV